MESTMYWGYWLSDWLSKGFPEIQLDFLFVLTDLELVDKNLVDSYYFS